MKKEYEMPQGVPTVSPDTRNAGILPEALKRKWDICNTGSNSQWKNRRGRGNILVYLRAEPFPFIFIGASLLSWPKDKISCILSGQSEFNLRAKSSTSLHEVRYMNNHEDINRGKRVHLKKKQVSIIQETISKSYNFIIEVWEFLNVIVLSLEGQL